MSRIAKQAIVNVLAETGERIKSFDSSGNGQISRAEIKHGVSMMEDGVDRKLTETFAKFIDHRDAKPGARITASDVDKAVDYAKEHMINRLDKNSNGLSKSELRQGSLIAQLAAQAAKAKE